MLKRLIPQVLLLLAYETLVVLALIAAVRWLSIQQAPPVLRGLAFLAGMALFVPPLMLATVGPYRAPGWLKAVQAQGRYARAEVLRNEHIGDYWRPQDMPRFVTLKVRVEPGGEPPEGGQAFQARLTCRLDEAQALRVGTQVRVRYDPQKPDQVALDA